MPTIKHVGTHVDDLHDGRPIVPYASVTLTDEELALDHYQQRLAAGSLLLVPDDHLPQAEPVPDKAGEVEEVEQPADGLDDLTVAELHERAETTGLDLPKRTSKPDLIQALRATTQED